MDVRVALPSELPHLVTRPGEDERNASTAGYLTDLLDKKCTRPEWCLVADDGSGKPVGSAVLWTLPGHALPMALVLAEAPWQEPGLETGQRVLAAALDLARSLGATGLEYMLDSPAQPPQHQADAGRRAELLRLAGFETVRDGRRFRRFAEGGLHAAHDGLAWSSLTETGREPFVDLLATALPTSADTRLAALVVEHGARGAAERLLADMEELAYEPHWWEIGHAPDGGAAALSLPARNPAAAVIGLVAVSPAYRGKGYATAVVARGTRVLLDSGADEIRGDCDAANVAMVKAFARAGYENFAERQEFLRRL
ncbi:GNAT family N-acetyltransferase [Streptomyces indicus]|uniref:Acetyltransferase (GNAT) family protein n=1 Tax=Streptomyces indicus TaxID=417292 RepID=A0A1G8ZNV8_9ACTN|nr:GNAT family N-acetyltransferase [Streptomyces indicus]SDK16274.1 Acetyltransferase (GNAT) family protein [Streptomyces indicus]